MSAKTIYLVIVLLGIQILVSYCLSVTPQNIPEPEGDDEVHFFCIESANSYATDITWQDPQGNLYTPGSPSVGGNSRITAEGSRLSISNLVRNDTGNYRCYRNSDPTDYAEGELLVYAPPKILQQMPIQEIHRGETSLISCIVDRGYPEANIHWLRMNETDNSVIVEITDTWDSRFRIVENGLEITDVRLTDEGTYRCYVQNRYGTKVLDIMAAFRASPQFVSENIRSDVTASLGQSVSLDCTAGAAPSPNYTWGVPPNSHSAQDSPLASSILNIQLTDESDFGEYSCTVSNGVGSISRHFTIYIPTPPQPTLKYHNGTVTLDQPAMINCTVHASPRPQFQWAKGNNAALLPQTSWTSTYDNIEGVSTLIYTFSADDLDKDCAILVVCVATNSYGNSKHYFTLRPDNPDICSSNLSTTAHTPTPSRPDIIPGEEFGDKEDSDEQGGEDGREESSVSNTKNNTFAILVALFSIAVVCIVVGVLALLVFFIKHFCCHKPKKAAQLSSSNAAVINQQSSTSDACTCIGTHTSISMEHSTGGVRMGNTGRLESIDSGVSVSSLGSSVLQTQCLCSRSEHATTESINSNSICVFNSQLMHPSCASKSSPQVCSIVNEGIYSRLNHTPPLSFAPCPNSSHFTVRSSNSSCSPLVQSQSSCDFDDSGVFLMSNNPVEPHPLFLTRQCSSLAARQNTSNRTRPNQPDENEMQSNPAYARFKISPSSAAEDGKPHEYEIVA